MANRYWVGGSATWDGTAGSKWSTTSGGAGGAAVPVATDDVFFDAASGAVTVTSSYGSGTCQGRNWNFTGFIGTFAGNNPMNIYGSLTCGAGMTWAHNNGVFFLATGAVNITCNGIIRANGGNDAEFNGVGGVWTLQDDWTLGQGRTSGCGVYFINGSLNFNNHNFHTNTFVASDANTVVITMGTGTLFIYDNSGGQGATINGSGLTLNGASGTIKFVRTTNSGVTFNANGKTLGTLWFAGGASTGINNVLGANTFGEIKDTGTAAHTMKFEQNVTNTITTWSVSGNPGNLITIDSFTTSAHTLVKAGGGIISADYLNIQHSVVTPGSTWYAGANSVNNQGVATAGSGWIFTAPMSAPTVTTQAASSVAATTTTGNGNVTSDGGGTITERGFVWGLSANPTTAGSKVTAAGTTGAYTASMTGLTANTLYHYRAYAINAVGTSYGADTTFTTAAGSPTATTQAVSSITASGATGNGNITNDGGSTITERGIVISLSINPTTANTKFTAAGTTGAFTAAISGLSPNVLYHVRAYAINAIGTSYGSDETFTTLALPGIVDTNPVTAITATDADGNGDVTYDGGGTISERGFVISTSANPTTADPKSIVAGTTGAFSGSMTGLTFNTLYHVRAYVINSAGTVYGSDVTFTTLPIAPTVTTQAVTSILDTTATGNGDVTLDNGATIIERGIVWGTALNPTIADGIATAAGTTGAFTAPITGLAPSTAYHARAYAINSAGISYGADVTFTTFELPTVTTQPTTFTDPNDISVAVANGNITFLGGMNSDKRGVIYDLASHALPGNLAPAFTGYVSKVEELGSFSTGAFTEALSALLPNSNYYIRAYAHNVVGYSYGNEVTFRTGAGGAGFLLFM